ncbi:MAG TPA: hypothetical protein VHT73_17130, partial [Thermodesulfobacteriota bacterium]|nr:hypothetical protein [Thermodesulfobacteriota bacterium]
MLEDSPGEYVRVFFVGVGEKLLKLSFVDLIRVQGDEAAHPVLDNPKVFNKSKASKRGAVKYKSLPQTIEEFEKVFPEGFYGDDYLQNERNYKVDAHNLMVDLLDQKSFDLLLTSHDYHEICNRAMQVVNRTNLIFQQEKVSLKNGLKSDRHEQLFGEKLYSLLYGEDKLESRFNVFCDCLADINAAKWTIATYFLFKKHYRGEWIDVEDGGVKSTVALVGTLSSPQFARHIAQFVYEIDRIKSIVSSSPDQAETSNNEDTFKEEFAGEKKYTIEKTIEAKCDHGLIVSDLASALQKVNLEIKNDRNRDLYTVNSESEIEAIFEIKTDISTTSLYSAIGQL